MKTTKPEHRVFAFHACFSSTKDLTDEEALSLFDTLVKVQSMAGLTQLILNVNGLAVTAALLELTLPRVLFTMRGLAQQALSTRVMLGAYSA